MSSISVFTFTMLGFEVVCIFSDEMDNLRKQIPRRSGSSRCPETLASVLPITVGSVLCVAIGEILTVIREKKRI